VYLTESYIIALDDSCVDDVLGDGIHDQNLLDNDCYKEIQSHMDLRNVPRNDYKTMTAEEAIKALIRDSVPLPDSIKKRLQDYQVNFTYLCTRKIFLDIHDFQRVHYYRKHIRI